MVPFHRGVKLSLGRTDCDICPISAILPYLATRISKPGALFFTEEGRVVTHPQFSAALISITEDTGLPVKEFNAHSFRIGAAITTKQENISNSHIKMVRQ